jgi:hypothetical protein
MSHSGKGICVPGIAVLFCLYFIATIGSAIASRQQERQRLSVSTNAILSSESFPSAASAPHRHSASQAKSTNLPPPGILAAPLFIADAEFSSGLGLVNGTGISTYADVILRAPDGTQIAQRRITFPPRSLRRIDLAEFLKTSGATATAGSIVVIPSAELKGPAILSSLAITYTNSQEPNFIDEKLALPSSASSQTLRGVADKGEGSPLVALTSLANESQHIAIQCLGPNGLSFSKTVILAAGQSILTEACSNLTSSVADLENPAQATPDTARPATGISLTSDGAPGSFAAFGLAPHVKSGSRFFSSVTFTDPKVWLSANSMFGGVPVGATTELGGGNYVPALSLANFSSNKAAHITVQYTETSDGTSSAHEIQTIAVPPGQTRDLVLDNLQGDPDLQNSFLVLSDASPGDLLTKLISVTPLRPGEVEMLGKDQLDRENVGTQPWSIEDGTESTILLFNHSGVPQTFHVLISGSASLWQKDYELQSMQTVGINIGSLIANKTKDDSGKIIPADATSGEVTWVIGPHGVGRGRILQSNATTGMARSFSCGGYATIASANWNSEATIVPDGSTVDIGGVVAVLDLVYSGCSGTYSYTGNSSGYGFYYWSSNPSILAAESPGNNYTVNAEGMTDGTATMYGTVTDNATGCAAQAQDTESVVADPMISSVVLSSNVIGTSGSMTITGTNLSGKGIPTIQFAGISGQFTAGVATVVDAMHVQANYTIACNAAPQNVYLLFPSFDGVMTNSLPVTTALPAAPAPTIKLGGNSVTGTQSVVVGQLISLTGTNPSLPPCMSFTTGSWSALPTGSMGIGGYVNAAGTAPPDLTGGQVLPLPPNNATGYTFYWVTAGNPLQMSYQYVMTVTGGSNYADSPVATITFNVAGPTALSVPPPKLGQVVIDSVPELIFGGTPTNVGIIVTASAAPPSGYSNNFFWTQINASDTKVETLNNNTSTTCYPATVPAGGDPFLDTKYKLSTTNTWNDNPSSPLNSSTFKELTRSFSATVYLMWDPGLLNSVPVPLGSVSWQWAGDAIYHGTSWTVKSSSSSANLFQPSSAYPQWTRYSDYTSYPCN